MTPAQVIKWFCKEQNIMGELQKVYFETHPKKYVLSTDENNMEFEYLSFDDYAKELFKTNRLKHVIDILLNNYKLAIVDKLGVDKGLVEYHKYYSNVWSKVIHKWEYFIAHNLKMNGIEVGDEVMFNHWGNIKTGKISYIHMKNSYLTIIPNNKKDKDNYPSGLNIRLYKMVDRKGTKKDVDFYIRKNRKYYGKHIE